MDENQFFASPAYKVTLSIACGALLVPPKTATTHLALLPAVPLIYPLDSNPMYYDQAKNLINKLAT